VFIENDSERSNRKHLMAPMKWRELPPVASPPNSTFFYQRGGFLQRETVGPHSVDALCGGRSNSMTISVLSH
jgi:hypothetical protein